MGKIKVLLAIRPGMIAEVVRHLVERQPDMAVIGEVMDLTELVLAIRTTGAEVVIITLADSDEEPGIVSDLLAVCPRLKIMALSVKGDTAVVYELGSTQKQMDDVGEAAILGAIREFRIA
jgi:DNA-binding NarL/FixJ family response regulator